MVETGLSGDFTPRQLFDDQFGVTPEDLVSPGPDLILELNVYPLSSTEGNFGTVDVGSADNSLADLARQIEFGVNADDMSYFPDSTFDPQMDDQGVVIKQIDVEGDTGISSGMKAALESILGHPRAIVLYTTVANPGNNAIYTIVEIVGVRFMDVNLTAKPKTVIIQPADYSDPAGIPDYDDDIGTETTFFTPLILAK
jgi:hypothetical protein